MRQTSRQLLESQTSSSVHALLTCGAEPETRRADASCYPGSDSATFSYLRAVTGKYRRRLREVVE